MKFNSHKLVLKIGFRDKDQKLLTLEIFIDKVYNNNSIHNIYIDLVSKFNT